METTQLDERRIRAAQNQSFFREVNERIGELSVDWHSPAARVCECLDSGCVETIEITLAEYERVRSEANSFFVAKGHEIAEIEETIGETDRYLVVRKLGAGADTAIARDPRAHLDLVG